MKNIVQLVQNLLKPYIDRKDRATQANIAPVETDATSASQSYAQGAQLILNDVLYDVTASIAQGDALTVGTNIAAADDVVTQLASVNGALTNEIDKAYKTDDAAITEVASDDLLPIYDTSAMAKRKMPVQKFAEQLISNRNLLDNGWFTVNQRGFTTNSSQGDLNYTVDRWNLIFNPNGRTFSITSDGITCDENDGWCIIWQLFAANKSANMAGKTVTGSILLSDGTILTGTGIAPVKNGQDVTLINNGTLRLYLQYSDSDSKGLFATGLSFAPTKNAVVRAVKLEIGKISTLALDIRPEFATELLKCQRYFYRIQGENNALAGWLRAQNATVLWGYTQAPVAMRTKPTLTYSDLDDWCIEQFGGSTVNQPITSITISSSTSSLIKLRVQIDSSVVTVSTNEILPLKACNKNAYLDFSADL